MNNVTNNTQPTIESRRQVELTSIVEHLEAYLKQANNAAGGQLLGGLVAAVLDSDATPEFNLAFAREIDAALVPLQPAQSGKSQIEPTLGADHVPRPE